MLIMNPGAQDHQSRTIALALRTTAEAQPPLWSPVGTLAQAREAVGAGIQLYWYELAREASATHREVLEAHASGADIDGYAICRREGVLHGEALEAHALGASLRHYARCAESGVPRQDILEAQRAGADLLGYSMCIKAGATGTEALAAHAAGMSLVWYAACRREAASHQEALALAFSGPFSQDSAPTALLALRIICRGVPVPQIGEMVGVLAQDWAGTPDELAACVTAALEAPPVPQKSQVVVRH